jgi:hypothetical protein
MATRLEPVSVTPPSYSTLQLDHHKDTRNSDRYILHVHGNTAEFLLPLQIMLGFGVYFFLSWTVPSATECLLLLKINCLHNSGDFQGCLVLKHAKSRGMSYA